MIETKSIVLGDIPVVDGQHNKLIERLQQNGLEFTLEQAEEMLAAVRSGRCDGS